MDNEWTMNGIFNDGGIFNDDDYFCSKLFDDGSFYINASMPGVEKQDIELAFNDKRLIIKGKSEKLDKTFYHQFKIEGSFLVNKAKLSYGVLTVFFAKKEKDITSIEIE